MVARGGDIVSRRAEATDDDSILSAVKQTRDDLAPVEPLIFTHGRPS
jgi:hypothetical protein